MRTSYAAYRDRFPFDPTYGFTLEQLLALKGPGPEAEPADFDAFWRRAHEETLRVPLDWEERRTPLTHPDYRLTEIYFDTLNGWRVGAWLCRPERDTDVRRVLVVGHGYGGRELPEYPMLDGETAALFLFAPGFGLSVDPNRVASQDSAKHVLTGITSPETYILRDCAAAFWSAATLMLELFPGQPLFYRGWSFGGGMGTLMLPWDRRYAGAELGQPTFSNHPFRVRHQSVGSAESVRQYSAQHPEIAATLRYYESVFAARRIAVPVVFGLSIFDPAVPAPGQFPVANAVDPKLVTRVHWLFGHVDFTYPEQADEANAQFAAVQSLYRQAQA